MAEEDDPRHEIKIETVAEVQAVAREAVSVNYYRDDERVYLSQSSPYRDYQSIGFPLSKAREIAAAIIEIAERADTGTGP